MSNTSKMSVAHVTHEAVEQLGGIGTVLEGMLCSPVYQLAVGRSVLVGPCNTEVPAEGHGRLDGTGEVLYSSVDGIDTAGLGRRLRPIEWAFGTPIVYGRRVYDPPGQGRTGEADVLLIDTHQIDEARLNVFKGRLWSVYGLDCKQHEWSWDFEEFTRLAEPAFYALNALLSEEELPCVVFAHEFMGMPTALKAELDGGGAFRSVFHAHECSTARSVVEHDAGHDTRFYAALKAMRQTGETIEGAFGPLGHLPRHALISQSHRCGAVFAVGHDTAAEMRALTESMRSARVHVAYNGLPQFPVDAAAKEARRAELLDYVEPLVGYRPDVVLTHVTRPVTSKGLWRDAMLLKDLVAPLRDAGLSAAYVLLTSAAGTRDAADVARMSAYGWPGVHREGFPDLVGPEVGLWEMFAGHNKLAGHERVQAVVVNQFGWSRGALGEACPEGLDFAGLRIGADVELGMATYEPFGISPLEPLAAGAVCVISEVCGCAGLVRSVTGATGAESGTEQVLIADYTPREDLALGEAMRLGAAERDAIERAESVRLASALVARLPRDAAQRAAAVARGQALVAEMGWDQVLAGCILPELRRLVG